MDYTELVFTVYKLEHETLAVDYTTFKTQTSSHTRGSYSFQVQKQNIRVRYVLWVVIFFRNQRQLGKQDMFFVYLDPTIPNFQNSC